MYPPLPMFRCVRCSRLPLIKKSLRLIAFSSEVVFRLLPPARQAVTMRAGFLIRAEFLIRVESLIRVECPSQRLPCLVLMLLQVAVLPRVLLVDPGFALRLYRHLVPRHCLYNSSNWCAALFLFFMSQKFRLTLTSRCRFFCSRLTRSML